MRICTRKCGCGRAHHTLRTTKPVQEGQRLVLQPVWDSSSPRLAASYDGSYKGPGVAGGGVVYWILGDGPPRVLEEIAVPMPRARSAQVAEAHAAVEAVCRADEVGRKHGVPIGEELLIVGGADMVTRCLRGRARDNAADVNEALEEARGYASKRGRPIKAMHVPREANSDADRVASRASVLAKACRGDENPPVHMTVIARRPAPWCEPLEPLQPAGPRTVILEQARTSVERFDEVCEMDEAQRLMRAGEEAEDGYFYLLEAPPLTRESMPT